MLMAVILDRQLDCSHPLMCPNLFRFTCEDFTLYNQVPHQGAGCFSAKRPDLHWLGGKRDLRTIDDYIELGYLMGLRPTAGQQGVQWQAVGANR